MESSSWQRQPPYPTPPPEAAARHPDRSLRDPAFIKQALDDLSNTKASILSPLCCMAYICVGKTTETPPAGIPPSCICPDGSTQGIEASLAAWKIEQESVGLEVGLIGTWRDEKGMGWLHLNPIFGRDLPDIIVRWSYPWALKEKGNRHAMLSESLRVVSRARHNKVCLIFPHYTNLARLGQVYRLLRELGSEERPRCMVEPKTTLHLGKVIVEVAELISQSRSKTEQAREHVPQLTNLMGELLDMIDMDEEDKLLAVLTRKEWNVLLQGRNQLRARIRLLLSK